MSGEMSGGMSDEMSGGMSDEMSGGMSGTAEDSSSDTYGTDQYGTDSTYGENGDVVTRYCEYGSVSQDQLDSCESHVSEADVNGYNTNAAMFARGEIGECAEDSGPFCAPD